MKTLWLLGGMSYTSTSTYYDGINKWVNKVMGKLHSAPLLIHSFDFEHIEQLQHKEEWITLSEELTHAAKNLESIWAQWIIICTNTMHLLAENIQKNITIPIIHIADAVGKKLKNSQIQKVWLLGTRFTMEKDFYRTNIEKYSIEVITPEKHEREEIHRIIYDELCINTINPDSRQVFLWIIENLRIRGAQAIILWCTEIGLLVHPTDTPVPLYDSTEIHVEESIQFITG